MVKMVSFVKSTFVAFLFLSVSLIRFFFSLKKDMLLVQIVCTRPVEENDGDSADDNPFDGYEMVSNQHRISGTNSNSMGVKQSNALHWI